MRTAAAQYIRERRVADPVWVRRNRRSLGRNKQHRACIRRRSELQKEMDKLFQEKQSSRVEQIAARLNEFLGRVPRMFTRMNKGATS